MSRNLKATRNTKIARVRRDAALARPEMLQPSAPRVPAAGITSMAVKVQDPEIRKMIDDAMKKLGGGGV